MDLQIIKASIIKIVFCESKILVFLVEEVFYFLQSCPNINVTVILENTTSKTIPKFIHLQVNSHLGIVVTQKEY